MHASLCCDCLSNAASGATQPLCSHTLALFSLSSLRTHRCDRWMLDYLQKADGGVDAVVAIYFVSFIGLVAIVVFNIIVGVLIEAFISSMSQDDSSKRTAAEAKEHHRNAGAMDPLLATLANFTSPQHLTSQIELIFCLWDVDDRWTSESCRGVCIFSLSSPICL